METQKTELLDFLRQEPEVSKVRDRLLMSGEAVVYGLYEGQRMLVTASLAQQWAQGNHIWGQYDTRLRGKASRHRPTEN